MEKPELNYVRTFRQRHALSERELAFLISRSQQALSSIEFGDSVPNLDAALALQVLFRIEPKDLFPGCFERVEDRVMRRAADLIEKLGAATDRRSEAKLAFLEGLPDLGNSIEL